MKWRSLWQTPLATVRTSTSRPMGLAMSTFSIVSSLCGPWNTAAFMNPSLGWGHPRRVPPFPSGIAVDRLLRAAFAGDEFGERGLGLGAPGDVERVVSLV